MLPPNQWWLYDVLGNVAEWTSSVYVRPPTDELLTDPFYSWDREETRRVMRGGDVTAWQSACGVAFRPGSLPQGGGGGFRLVRTLP